MEQTKQIEQPDKVIFQVNSLKEANEALRLLGSCEIDLGKYEARLNSRIQKIKEEIEPDIEHTKLEMREIIEAIRIFAEEHKEELFTEKRSIDLRYGIIGFQKSTQLVCQAGVDWKKVLETAKKAYPEYVAITWNLIKDAIKKAPERTQDKLGVQIEEKDNFYAAGKDKKRYQV